MSARELITDHLDLWTGAVTKKSSSGRGSNFKVELTGVEKLRELILELAFRGKLTEQDAGDEPAEQLIERIATQKANTRNGKRGAPQPPKSETPISQPFQVPSTWAWVPLRETGLTSTGKTPSTKNASFFSGDIPFIGPGQVTVRGKITKPEKLLSEEGAAHTEEALPGDILTVCIGGSIGKTAKVSERCGFNQQLNKIRPILVESDYLFFAISAKFFQEAIRENAAGSATPIINRSKWESICIPLAPFTEQKRIVQKVDELMALCDRLEQQTSDQLEAHEALIGTLLGTLTQSENATEVADNWGRLAAHFHTLFTTEQSIDKLKQTILQLAVMGRLVEQSPLEGNASVLLHEIADEKKRLVGTGVLKRKKNNVAQNESELFAIPLTWSWVISNEICALITDGEHNTPERTTDATAVPLATAKNVRDGYIDLTNTDFVPLGVAETCWNRCKPELGDILMVSVGATLGRLAIMRDSQDMVLVRSVTLLRPIKMLGEYLAIYLQAPTTQSWIWRNVRQSAQPCLYLSKSSSIPVSVPPLAEQHRIVQKVDELIALCEQLKERLNQASETRCQLAEAVVEGALN